MKTNNVVRKALCCMAILAMTLPGKAAEFTAEDFTIARGETKTIGINLQKSPSETIDYSGLQFDVALPPELNITKVAMGSGAPDFTIESKLISADRMRIIAYANGYTHYETKENLVELTFKTTADAGPTTVPVNILNPMLSTPIGGDLLLDGSSFMVKIEVPPAGIILTPDNVTLLAGTSTVLTTTIWPDDTEDKSVIWSSGNESVATVSTDGTVTAVGEGTTEVTATCGEVAATCIVTVYSMDDENVSVKPGDGTDQGDEDDTPGSNTENGGSLIGTDLTLRVGQTASIDLELPADLTETPAFSWSLGNGGEQYVTLQAAENTLSAVFTGRSVGETTYSVTFEGKEVTGGKVTVIAETPIESLLLNPSKIEMAKNALPVTITPEYQPDNASVKTLTWTSSDPGVATVEDGVVTPVGEGHATITATSTDGSGMNATCEVTVTAPIDENFEFEFDEAVMGGVDSIEIYIGDSYTLKPKAQEGYVLPDNISWTSDRPTIVSVDDKGKVTGLALGDANITASATVNGKEVSATCKVTVKPIMATSISLNVKDETIFVASSTKLVATVSPSNVTDKTITWTSSKPEIATVSDSGEVYGVSVGTTIVTATIGTVSASCQINVVHRIPDMDPSVTTSERDIKTITGSPVNMAVYAQGGEPTGWSYLWTKNGETVSKSNELNITAINNTETVITETYKVKVENEIDKVVIFSEVYDFVVLIYPAVEEIPDEQLISISTGTDSPDKTREGNIITLSAKAPNGGYPQGWEYVWSEAQREIDEGETVETIATMTSGDSMAIETTSYDLAMTNYSPEGDVWAQFNLKSNPIAVYRRPQTPLQMLRKGDGTSHTFVAMMSLSDLELERLDYRFVYGWTDADGNDHIMEQTNERYCYTDAEIYNNPTNKFWVYSIWVYNDGCMVSSGLRYLDGSADENFDASVFDGSYTYTGKTSRARSGIYSIDGHYMGTDSRQLAPGIYIVITENHGMISTEKIIIR